MPGVETGWTTTRDVSDEKELSVSMRALFPGSAGIGVEAVVQEAPEERIREEWGGLLSRLAPVRRNEFLAGRRAAEDALAEWLPRGTYSIGIGSEREPIWPEGFCGSLSHSREWAVAAGGKAESLGSVGVDLEDPRRLSPKTWRLVLTPGEQDWIHLHIPEEEWKWWGTLLFSLKECFYKWQYPLTGAWLGFQDVEVELETTGSCGSARLRLSGSEGPPLLVGRTFSLGYRGNLYWLLTGMWGHPNG